MTKRIIKAYEKLPIEVKSAINKEFPDGINNQVKLIRNVMSDGCFSGFLFEYNETVYLIKYTPPSPKKKADSANKNKDEEEDNEIELADDLEFEDDSIDDL